MIKKIDYLFNTITKEFQLVLFHSVGLIITFELYKKWKQVNYKPLDKLKRYSHEKFQNVIKIHNKQHHNQSNLFMNYYSK